MPLYNYECAECGPFVSLRELSDRNRPAFCPDCQRIGKRAITAPNLCLMPASRRKAHAVNERSRHEPRVRRGHQCSSGCGCAPKSEAKSGTMTQFKTAKANSRPWMLGH